ncbi:MAG: four helix bundle protein [Saprospiraceae bacterium]
MTNKEFNELFRSRTKKFALQVIDFLDGLSYSSTNQILSKQLCKSATSAGSNFRAFCRGRSKNEMFAKICIVVEEADETIYWLELFLEGNCGKKDVVRALLSEGIEISKVTTKIKDTMYRAQ